MQPGDTPGELEPPGEGRTFGMLCHLSALFLGFLGPLLFWLLKRDESTFVDDQGKEALNFQITVTIASIVSGIAILVLVGFILLPLVICGAFVLSIVAAVQANNGVRYRYPVCIRFIK